MEKEDRRLGGGTPSHVVEEISERLSSEPRRWPEASSDGRRMDTDLAILRNEVAMLSSEVHNMHNRVNGKILKLEEDVESQFGRLTESVDKHDRDLVMLVGRRGDSGKIRSFTDKVSDLRADIRGVKKAMIVIAITLVAATGTNIANLIAGLF